METSHAMLVKEDPRKRILKRTMLLVALAFIGFLALAAGLLLLFQQRIIYAGSGSGYPENWRETLPLGLEVVEYETDGRQYAYYLPPLSGTACPSRVYVMFGGNATRALDLFEIGHEAASTDWGAGAFLIDYPGYGANQGVPGPGAIERAAVAAHQALEQRLGLGKGELEGRVSVLGHSMGCAAALSYVRHVRPERVVLVAPFTSLRDMAKRAVSWPLCLVLKQDWDNRESLAALCAGEEPPEITILHGTADLTVPHSMGEALAESQPGKVRFVSIPGGTHGDILYDDREAVFSALGILPKTHP